MKKKYLFIFLIISFVIEITLSIVLINNFSNVKNDTVKINELVNEIERNYPNSNNYPSYYSYVILDKNSNKVYSYNYDINSLNEAYKNSDTIVDLNINDNTYKLIIKNRFNDTLESYRTGLIILIASISLVQLLAFVIYYYYLYKTTIKPFSDMKEFAERVAGGNLDIPLNMDRANQFGAFTESFDIMREELKKARIKEKEANDSKRELVAKLSHDIKTPVASIKSTSELGMVVSKENKIKGYFDTINQKSDQINTLVGNLLSSSLDDLNEIKINPVKCSSIVLYELIKNSDYLNKVEKYIIPECNIYADRSRLQQVLDNIFANSYKYANTEIEVNVTDDNDYLVLSIKDFGDSVDDMDLPLLTEKYKRGSNAKDKDGVGLGLYISKQFVELMDGTFEIKNCHPGFNTIIKLRKI